MELDDTIYIFCGSSEETYFPQLTALNIETCECVDLGAMDSAFARWTSGRWTARSRAGPRGNGQRVRARVAQHGGCADARRWLAAHIWRDVDDESAQDNESAQDEGAVSSDALLQYSVRLKEWGRFADTGAPLRAHRPLHCRFRLARVRFRRLRAWRVFGDLHVLDTVMGEWTQPEINGDRPPGRARTTR